MPDLCGVFSAFGPRGGEVEGQELCSAPSRIKGRAELRRSGAEEREAEWGLQRAAGGGETARAAQSWWLVAGGAGERPRPGPGNTPLGTPGGLAPGSPGQEVDTREGRHAGFGRAGVGRFLRSEPAACLSRVPVGGRGSVCPFAGPRARGAAAAALPLRGPGVGGEGAPPLARALPPRVGDVEALPAPWMGPGPRAP